MALILNIDTALDDASVSLAENGKVLLSDYNHTQKDHAAWIQTAISELVKRAGIEMKKLNAVGVNIGPGSYTGLRIGLSTAKGICYALNLPLITEKSLKTIAFSGIKFIESSEPPEVWQSLLYCPMIDARRMEVFTAMYNFKLEEIWKPQACILNEVSFKDELKRQKILFLGNGSIKFQSTCQNSNALFKKVPLDPSAFSELTYKNFIGNNFADLIYAEPFYLKEFFAK
jgi:tRNA threonylcarbamoyladenosine biosynthesis protein TsaB